MKEYIISIVMPTFNSERTLEQSLLSIRNQNFPQEQVEILIIDGGSTDQTIEIATKYDAVVLENTRRLPEFAKQIGLLQARGEYIIFIDSDESFEDMNSFTRRIQLFRAHPEIKNLVSTGQKCAQDENGVSRYANYIGDPFSNFVYRFNGYDRTKDLTRQYHFRKEEGYYLFDFTDSAYLPLFDALGNMFEVKTAKKIYIGQGENTSFAANIFSNMARETNRAAMLENDYIYHQPGLSVANYLQKLKWRVKNNLFQTDGVGFAERNKRETGLSKRKFMFIPYCALIVPVLVDAACMVKRNRDSYFWHHILYTEYTFITIAWYVFLKMIGYQVKMDRSYGKG